MMTATNMLTATNASLPPKKALSAVGALEIPSTTRVLVRPHTNAVDSRQENHTTSPAPLISEPLTARVMLAISELRNAASAMTDNSQISHHALTFATETSHMPNATVRPRSATSNASKVIPTATPEITAIPYATNQDPNAMSPVVNALTATAPAILTAKN